MLGQLEQLLRVEDCFLLIACSLGTFCRSRDRAVSIRLVLKHFFEFSESVSRFTVTLKYHRQYLSRRNNWSWRDDTFSTRIFAIRRVAQHCNTLIALAFSKSCKTLHDLDLNIDLIGPITQLHRRSRFAKSSEPLRFNARFWSDLGSLPHRYPRECVDRLSLGILLPWIGIPLERNFTSVDIELLNAIIRPIFRKSGLYPVSHLSRRSLLIVTNFSSFQTYSSRPRCPASLPIVCCRTTCLCPPEPPDGL